VYVQNVKTDILEKIVKLLFALIIVFSVQHLTLAINVKMGIHYLIVILYRNRQSNAFKLFKTALKDVPMILMYVINVIKIFMDLNVIFNTFAILKIVNL
jgi:hypothetical protein